jgi:hypothetical protein
MNERDEFLTFPEDAVLDKHLLALKRFGPHPGFEDRVLARVVLPAPALVAVRRRASAMATPRRLWWASGLAAASSTAWIVGLANWLSAAKLSAATAWLTAEAGLPLWSSALHVAALGSKTLTFYAMSAYSAFGNGLFGAAAVAMIAPVLGSWGLYLTMKQTRGKRIPAYAAR